MAIIKKKKKTKIINAGKGVGNFSYTAEENVK
jgi:hypothetical protein